MRYQNSTNDVYEIDYSDYDDQETESSQASGNLEKLNKTSGEVKASSEINRKPYVKEHYMSNSDNELDEIDYPYHSKANDKSSKINQIIEDYKIEVGSINQRHHHTMDTTTQLNNSKAKPSVASKLNQSTNPIIKNYLKAKEQDVDGSYNNRVSITTANKKLNELSKKPKTFKDLSKPKQSNSMAATYSKASPTKPMQHHQPPQHSTIDKTKKPKSPSSIYARQDSNLDEFQIEKVVSWMTVNEDNFSEFECVVNGQVNGSKSMETRKGNEHDSTYQEIADIIKEIEHDRKDCEDFKTLKTDVEFKLNTILNSIESPDDNSPSTECHDGSNNKLK